jgi:hypothetical protein
MFSVFIALLKELGDFSGPVTINIGHLTALQRPHFPSINRLAAFTFCISL